MGKIIKGLSFLKFPFLPLETLLKGLETIYGVIAGLAFTEVFSQLNGNPLFSNELTIIQVVQNLIFIILCLFVSSMFFLMTWSEIFGSLRDNDLFNEFKMPDHPTPFEKKEKVSYMRILPSTLLVLTFSIAPTQISNILFEYWKILFLNISSQASSFQIFFGWVTLALLIFNLWRLFLTETSRRKSDAWDEVKKQLMKTVGLNILSLVGFIYYFVIFIPSGSFYYYVPIFSMIVFMFLSWIIVYLMQRFNEFSDRYGLFLHIILLFVILSFYLYIT